MAALSGIPTTAGPAAGTGAPEAVLVSDDDRASLLELARVTVAVAVRAREPDDLRTLVDAGRLPSWRAGAFVTLTELGDLRGCMGSLDQEEAVWRSVAEAATMAARGDPRFDRVEADELAWIEVDVSVLGPMTPLDDPAAFRPGVDGILVSRDGRRALLLPEVAGMLPPGHDAMLDAVCRKAGLPLGAWRDPSTALRVFRTCRFGGPLEG
jgi:AmmeMemoRadiSam system protein A